MMPISPVIERHVAGIACLCLPGCITRVRNTGVIIEQRCTTLYAQRGCLEAAAITVWADGVLLLSGMMCLGQIHYGRKCHSIRLAVILDK